MARRVWGWLCIAGGVVCAGLGLWLGVWWLWLIAVAAIGGGAFALYEAKKKWCVMRAMGVKTPM